MSQHFAEVLIPEAARVRIGPAEMALTRTLPDPSRSPYSARSLPETLLQTHNVVVRDSALSAKVGKGQRAEPGFSMERQAFAIATKL